ncbi:MAG: DUF1638 domain-containing protein [Armatimonadota bacterium]
MKLYALACEVFAREASQAAAISPHTVYLDFLSFGLHNTPDKLRETVQARIDAASGYDCILLAYGLCSRGLADIAARDIPLVIPRAHDCITLLLGSKERYREEFDGHPGTYYYSPGWIERKEGDIRQGVIEVVQEREAEKRFQEYCEKYGEDNARYLLEQEAGWAEHYNRAALIDVGLGDIEYFRRFTRQVADSNGWSCEEIRGNLRLIDNLFAGRWDPAEFLLVQPGERTVEAVNAGIISTESR